MRLDRFRVVAVVAVLAVIVLVPAVASDSDAAETERLLPNNIVHGIFQKTQYDSYNHLTSGLLYFIDGSENHARMLSFLEDPYGNDMPGGDDRRLLDEYPNGTSVHVYRAQSWWSGEDSIYTGLHRCEADLVLEPSSLTFFVKAGDTFSITCHRCSTNLGTTDMRPYVVQNYEYNYLDPTFTHTYTSSTEVEVGFGDTGGVFYVDMTYDVSGASTPNGSATVYIAVCALVAVVVLGILAYAAVRPKWSK